jgi:predicted histidine transporter YuiF (NhaC family)
MGDFFSSSLGIAALVIGILVAVYFISPKPKNMELEETNKQEEQVAVSKVSSAKEEEESKQRNIELVAAIAAALSAYLDVPASRLMIKSINRVDGNNSAWRERGLEDY